MSIITSALGMNGLDLRQISVSLVSQNKSYTFSSPLYITANGDKNAGKTSNSCRCEIGNVNSEVLQQVLNTISPYKVGAPPASLIISAGRQSTGLFQIFKGDIQVLNPSQPPKVSLLVQCQTKAQNRGQLVSHAAAATAKLSDIAKTVAKANNMNLSYEVQQDMQVSSWFHSGSAYDGINNLRQVAQKDIFIDDDTLIVKDVGTPRKSSSFMVSQDTGMIGVPELTQHGVKVKCLLQQGIAIGGKFSVESRINSAANGDYECFKLSFDIATRQNQFYWIIEGKNNSFAQQGGKKGKK